MDFGPTYHRFTFWWLLAIGVLMARPSTANCHDYWIIHYRPLEAQVAQGKVYVWLWGDLVADVPLRGRDDFGCYAVIDLRPVRRRHPGKTLQIYCKFKLGPGTAADWSISPEGDRVWQEKDGWEVWTVQGVAQWYHSAAAAVRPKLRGGYLDGPNQIMVQLDRPLQPITARACTLQDHQGHNWSLQVQRQQGRRLWLQTQQPLDPLSQYWLGIKGLSGRVLLIPRKILRQWQVPATVRLGLSYQPQQSVFRLFAPRARAVTLHLYRQAQGGHPICHPLQRHGAGYWEVCVPGDWQHYFYTYHITADFLPSAGAEITDPYARCVSPPAARALIFQDHGVVSPAPQFSFAQAIIYELHVRDFTIDPLSAVPAALRGKYLGLTQRGTTLPQSKLATGLDHLRELGVNVIQLMPLQDFANNESLTGYNQAYNWGYMPIHFFNPEGWYASTPHGTARVQELKAMVSTLHQAGFKVTLDVVFNHTAEMGAGGPLYHFKGIDPYYYYRFKPDGSYSNGSGCGNELNTQNPLVRRFIIDCLRYWVEFYGFDGFRFDLLGLYDQQTIRAIRQALPGIFLYGEPWTAGPSTIEPFTKGRQRGLGIAVFNDHFRDAIKGSIWQATAGGYVQQGRAVARIQAGIQGSISDFASVPQESINYVACHDNHTLYDKLALSVMGQVHGQPTPQQEKLIIKLDRLAAFLILTSQGVPFLHAGQEMLRSKHYYQNGQHCYCENSYNAPDAVNRLDWSLKAKYYQTFRYYQGLITLRKSHPILRKTTAAAVQRDLHFQPHLAPTDKCLAYTLRRGDSADSWRQVLVLINPEQSEQIFKLLPGKWEVAVDADHAGTVSLRTLQKQPQIRVPASSAMLLFQPEIGQQDKPKIKRRG